MDARIGSYELLDRLGQGATSDVYRARHVTLDREAAVKVLLPRLTADASARAMFLRESRLIARLDHPNVVRVYEAGEHEGALFIAMELVSGRDLRSLLDATGRLSPAQTLAVVGQVAAALDAAHAAGLVHRDVKPSNILLAGTGRDRVLLSDFGLTTALDSQTRVSGAGHLVGSIPYMPPEQLEGKRVSPRSDVYALACVAYECLVGSPPFDRPSDVEVLWAHIRDAPRQPSDTDSSLRAFDRPLQIALAKSPQDRPTSAGQFFDYLSGAQSCPRVRLGMRSPRLVHGRVAAAAASVALALGSLTWAAVSPSPRSVTAPIVPTPEARSGPADEAAAQKAGPSAQPGPASAGPIGAAVTSRKDRDSSDRPLSSAASPQSGNSVGRAGVAVPATGALRPRVESLPYDASPVVDCVETTADQVGCVQLETRAGESSIHVAIRDQTRMPIRAWIRQDVDRDGDFDGDWIEICAQTDRPVPVNPRAIINISLETGRCGTEGRSVPTSGLVTVSLFAQS